MKVKPHKKSEAPYIRTVDSFYRFTIPYRLREQYGIELDTEIIMETLEEGILIKPYNEEDE